MTTAKPKTKTRKYLKGFLKRKKLMEQIGHKLMMEIPGEPFPYCIHYKIGTRTLPATHFRNKQYRSMLRAIFPDLRSRNQPAVLLVRFYVSPHEGVDIPAKDLKAENRPAVEAFEIADYLLSFLEMIHSTLIGAYKQLVKIDAEKFYSDRPRTVFKFMHWISYVKHQTHDTFYSDTKSKRKVRQGPYIQPYTEGYEASTGSCQRLIAHFGGSAFIGCAARHCPFSDTLAEVDNPSAQIRAAQLAPLKAARRRQLGKVPE